MPRCCYVSRKEVTNGERLTKKYWLSPYLLFSVWSTSTLSPNIQFSKNYSDFWDALFIGIPLKEDVSKYFCELNRKTYICIVIIG